jgi:zinc protease
MTPVMPRASLFLPALTLCCVLLLPAAVSAAEPFYAKLENGMTVYILEEHKAPVVTVQIWYHVGGRNELSGRTGLAHLLEHMMFKGTTKYGKGEYSRLIAKDGGTENAFTANDETVYFSTLSSDKVALALELEADRMSNLLLDPKEVALERNVVKEERRMRTDDDPQSLLVESDYAMAFPAHPYGRPVIGWMDDISRLTRDELAAFYHRYYVPNNATLVVVGDVTPKEIMPVIQRTFGAIPARAFTYDPITPEQPQYGERRFILKREAQLPVVFMGYHVPNYSSTDADALEVLGTILSSGKSSRLFQDLVYTQRIALSADGGYDPLTIDGDLFNFYAMAQPGHTHEELEAALDKEIERLQNEPVSDHELQKAKNGLLAAYIFGQDSNFFRAMQIGQTVNVGAGVEYIDTYTSRIQAVTKEQVQEAAKRFLLKDHRTVGYLVPLPSPESGAPPTAPSPQESKPSS